MTPVRYPAGPITPHGAYYLKKGWLPTVSYTSPDITALFNMLGGPAIADPMMPEAVTIKSLKGLIPPWQNIKQKGATQDGSTYITSLYDELAVDIGIEIRGRDPIWTRQVKRDWIASWDAKTAGTLSWSTLELGHWWANTQLEKAPVDLFTGGLGPPNRQKFTWNAMAYNAFWRTDDDVDSLQGNGFKFLRRLNVGDQVMSDEYTCIGPGLFHFQDGPGSSYSVFYGPLGAGQKVQIRTDPRKRGAVPLAGSFSVWPYSLLQGRFSDNAAIPPKPAGAPATPYYVNVGITGGNSDSMIIASGTPLRRMPY